MDTQALAAFVAIVDHQSFSEAAEALHLTQPAVSKRLASLENQLGAPLVERGQRNFNLTESGQRLLPYARRILDELHNARLDLSSTTGQIGGRLPVIASHHIGLHHLPAWLRRFNRDYPDVTLELQFMDSESAFDHLKRRTCELAFVTLNDAMDQQFDIKAQWEDPMVFVTGTTHPLASQPEPELADLARYDALLPDTRTATYRVISRLFMAENRTLKLQMPTNYLETIKMMTSVGLGWSVLPRSMVDTTLTVLPIRHDVSRMLGGIGLEGRHLSPAAEALVAIARELH
ncbi:LysR family transcriptional regulator [Marinobacter halodurans]|uniref:LysR family transcriptional regulator n=1 Tax=Marinobacter halodurans TaxID=2528979 RepID=A0ABY1ZJ17_9GAMM|nr:LysR family transcriptional regulator [Marinobacter halodurans]TBW54740.1 LysR family transcriptional regulator [Marinobacter halodurans]